MSDEDTPTVRWIVTGVYNIYLNLILNNNYKFKTKPEKTYELIADIVSLWIQYTNETDIEDF